MKYLWLIACGAVVLPAAGAGPENLVKNGTFEAGLANWEGRKLENPSQKSVPAPELIALETKDTSNKSKGALRFKLQKETEFTYNSHNSGSVCELTQNIPAKTEIKLTFYAKHLAGARGLEVSRQWGGGAAVVNLTDTWEKYEVVLISSDITGGLVFATVPKGTEPGITALADGEFLLDDVSVVIADKK